MSKQYDALPGGSGGTGRGCVDGGGLCTMCSSAGRCMKYQSQSIPFDHPHYNRESFHCPETGQHCHDPLCRKDFCLRKDRRKESRTPSERQWENIMEQLEQNIFYEKKKEIPAAAEKLIHIIAEQVGIIDHLTRNTEHGTKLVLSGLKYKYLTIKNSIIMALSLNVREFVTSTLGLVDHATQAPITDAAFSNQSYVSSNPEIAAVDGSGKVTGVAFGSTNIIVTTDVSYTGNDGQPKTETGKSLLVAVQVNVLPQTTDLTITFSIPQAVTV